MTENEDKNLPPSQRKLKRERKRGNVWISLELTHGLFLSLCFVFLLLFFKISNFKNVFLVIFSNINHLSLQEALKLMFRPLWLSMLLFLVAVFISCIAVYIAQRGWTWNFSRKNSLFMMRRKKQRRPFFFLVFLGLIGVSIWILYPRDIFLLNSFLNDSSKLEVLLKQSIILLGVLLGVCIFFGIMDFFYQRWAYLRRMRMSKREREMESKDENTKNMYKNR